jgi:3-isopropylmalate/(R)-2-methylmalate dehydratase large subunit
VVALSPAKRVLFLFKDVEKIRAQLRGEATFLMQDVDPADLLDDINTDVMTRPGCFRHKPGHRADAYAGLMDKENQRVFVTRALLDGGFEVIVGGQRRAGRRAKRRRKRRSGGIGLVIASSFAPIHLRNSINLGQLSATTSS